MLSSSSSLPTTFSPGLFFLEALDYAGFDSKCSIDEVFNLIATSSEFMNSAILPQFIMKREYAFDLPDAQRPFLFCNSLQFVRSLSIHVAQPTVEDEDCKSIRVDDCVTAFSFVDFLDRSCLFNFYLRKLDLRTSAVRSSQVLTIHKHVLRLATNLESLVLPIQSWDPSFCLIQCAANAAASTLIKLELIWPDLCDDERGTPRDRPLSLAPLGLFRKLESLSIHNEVNISERKTSFDWLTADLPICNTLKSLTLIDVEIAVRSFASLKNLRALNQLKIENSCDSEPSGYSITPSEFGDICDAVAETLTHLSLEPRRLRPSHLIHLKKLPNLRYLELHAGDIDDLDEDLERPSILDIDDDLPCFNILIELKLRNFLAPEGRPSECQEFLKSIFSKMKCLEVLDFYRMDYVDHFFATALDNLHHEAPLRRVSWKINSSRENVLLLPKITSNSIEKLELSADCRFFDEDDDIRRRNLKEQQIAEFKRLPKVFPNLVSLSLDHFEFVCESPLQSLECFHVSSVFTMSSKNEESLYQSISKNLFPQLRKLTLQFGFTSCDATDLLFLCKQTRKLQHHLCCLSVYGFWSAKVAYAARSILPVFQCSLDRREKTEEWKLYRGRRTVWDDDNNKDETSSIISRKDATGRRRQREDRASEDLS